MLGTGEHGVGVGKEEHLYEELGEGTVELMKTIKRTIHPLGLFDPGKVRFWFPTDTIAVVVSVSVVKSGLLLVNSSTRMRLRRIRTLKLNT